MVYYAGEGIRFMYDELDIIFGVGRFVNSLKTYVSDGSLVLSARASRIVPLFGHLISRLLDY